MYTKFSKEEKSQLITRYYEGESVSNICLEKGIARSTFYTWLKANTTSPEPGNSVGSLKIKMRIEKLSHKIEVLQKVNCTLSSPLKEKLDELERLHGQYSVHVLCEALEIPRATYYNHILRNKRKNTSYQIRRSQLSEKIKEVFDRSKQVYGAKKIRAILVAQGEIVSEKMVSELMHEMNLCSIRTSAKKNYIRLNCEKKKDALKMNFSVQAPNYVWVSDVTEFKLDNKKYYICVILDLYSRKVLAYRISPKHSTQLITGTFKLAYATRHVNEGLVFHSDRGVQYTSYSFQTLLKTCRINQSFSPSGKPHHNAVMESFFKNMKNEELYRTNYRSVNEFKKGVDGFIESYNTYRPHSALNNKTPNTYERLFYDRKN